MSEFSEHGSYSIKIKDHILIIDAKGPFNIELVTHYHIELNASIELLAQSNQPWSQIVILHEESLFTPEAEQKLIDSNRWRKTKGLSYCALVLVNPVGSKLITSQMTHIYRDAGIQMRIFDQIMTAKEWLTKRNSQALQPML